MELFIQNRILILSDFRLAYSYQFHYLLIYNFLPVKNGCKLNNFQSKSNKYNNCTLFAIDL